MDGDVLLPFFGVFATHARQMTSLLAGSSSMVTRFRAASAPSSVATSKTPATASLHFGGVSSTAMSNEPSPIRSGPFRYSTSVAFFAPDARHGGVPGPYCRVAIAPSARSHTEPKPRVLLGVAGHQQHAQTGEGQPLCDKNRQRGLTNPVFVEATTTVGSSGENRPGGS